MKNVFFFNLRWAPIYRQPTHRRGTHRKFFRLSLHIANSKFWSNIFYRRCFEVKSLDFNLSILINRVGQEKSNHDFQKQNHDFDLNHLHSNDFDLKSLKIW